jgi:hypothetical protein
MDCLHYFINGTESYTSFVSVNVTECGSREENSELVLTGKKCGMYSLPHSENKTKCDSNYKLIIA